MPVKPAPPQKPQMPLPG